MTFRTLLAAGTLLINATAASAFTAPARNFECYSINAHLTLSDHGEGRQMAIRIDQQDHNFSAEEITVYETAMGDLWEVKLPQDAETYDKYLTVILPTVYIPIGGSGRFNTKLVTTRQYDYGSFFSDPRFLANKVDNPSKYYGISCKAW